MFYINTENVRSAVASFSSGEQTLKRLRNELDDVRSNLSDLSEMTEVLSALEQLSNQILEESNQLGRFYEAGIQIVNEYRKAEENILNNQEGQSWAFGGGSSLQDFSGDGWSPAASNKIDYETLEELSGLFY